MSHTKEPWSIDEYGRVKADGCNEFLGVQVDGFSLNGGEESKANARRIVACVNACAGLSTDDLEKTGLVSAVGYQLLNADKERYQLRELCGELLSELSGLYENVSSEINQEHRKLVRLVITKAESILGEKNGR